MECLDGAKKPTSGGLRLTFTRGQAQKSRQELVLIGLTHVLRLGVVTYAVLRNYMIFPIYWGKLAKLFQ